MTLEQEKELRKKILLTENEKHRKLAELDKIEHEISIKAASLTDMTERVKQSEEELIGEDELKDRIEKLRVLYIEHKKEVKELQEKMRNAEEKTEHETADLKVIVKQQEHILRELKTLQETKEYLLDTEQSIEDRIALKIESVRIITLELELLKEEKKEIEVKFEEMTIQMEERDKSIQRAFADLRVYESRVRREYAIMFPEMTYNSPLEAIEGGK